MRNVSAYFCYCQVITNASRAVEFATMTLHPETKEPVAKIFRASELDALLQKLELGGTPDAEVVQGTGGGGAGEGSVAIST